MNPSSNAAVSDSLGSFQQSHGRLLSPLILSLDITLLTQVLLGPPTVPAINATSILISYLTQKVNGFSHSAYFAYPSAILFPAALNCDKPVTSKIKALYRF